MLSSLKSKFLIFISTSLIIIATNFPIVAAADDQLYIEDYSSLSIPLSPANNRWAYELINSSQANSAGFTGTGVKVALLDNGIDPRVINISSKVISRFDATYSISGQNDHGTATSSIVAADPMPEAGIGGVAPGASIMDVRVCVNSSCRTEWIIAGLKWAIDNGANVISMSIGGAQTLEPATAQLIKRAISQGIVVVAAAGNNACVATYTRDGQSFARNCTQNTLPISFPGSQSIAGLITVGAIGRDLTRNSYSNYGAYVDVVAPGTDVATFYPWGPNAYFAGTSAAAPIVSGVVALIKQAAPTATPEQIQAILQATTTEPVSTIPEVWESCAYLNNLWDCQNKSPARWPLRFYTGAGIVNAHNAVLMAMRLESQTLKTGLVAYSQDLAVTVDWSSVALGIGPFKIFVDGKLNAEISGTSYQITNLINTTQYAVQVVDAADSKTAPIIVTAGENAHLQTPVISSPQVYANAIYFNVAIEPNVSTGVLSLANGDQTTCIRSGSSLRFDCTYILTTNPVSGDFKLVDAQGNFGESSNSLSFFYSGLSATSGVNLTILSETSARASWNAISGATHYCYYDAGAGAWISTTATSAEISDAHPGSFQTFTVYASNASCAPTGLYSPTYWFLPFGPILLAPTNLIAENLTSSGVAINFQNPVGADRYAVYRSDGKNWITSSGGSTVSDIFADSDATRTFKYWITAIDDVRYGSQYGAISSPITITVPAQTTQNISSQPPSSVGGSGFITGSSTSSGFVSSSSITFNPKLRTNTIFLNASAKKIVLGKVVRVSGKSKSGTKVSMSVSGPCFIASNVAGRISIQATGLGKCQVYAVATANIKFNAVEKLLTLPVVPPLKTLRP